MLRLKFAEIRIYLSMKEFPVHLSYATYYLAENDAMKQAKVSRQAILICNIALESGKNLKGYGVCYAQP